MQGVACLRGGRLLFEGLDLRLEPGDVLWVRGPNGAGKSSLLRLAAGLLRPTAGSVSAAPAALADDALALDRERTLADALRFWARLDGGVERLREALAAVGLEQLRDVPVRMLSTGQARRARLARVLASGAPLWLLDEPLNGLDEQSIRRLADVISAHRRSGGAALVASHLPVPGDGSRVLELGG
jgi:heme exporter protein A